MRGNLDRLHGKFVMALDVIDLRGFYASALGRIARYCIGRHISERWDNCSGLSVAGLGYPTPYLGGYRDNAVRVLAFMPAAQGVVNWPREGVSSTALVDTTMLPLPDACIDRMLIVHALEMSDNPQELLYEVWRVLTPGGRMIVVAPNRRGFWARSDATPFGQGLPYSRGQLRDLMRETQFSPLHWAESLYTPPFARPFWVKMATPFERIGAKLSLPGAGVLIVEATKQVYSPVAPRKLVRRVVPKLAPVIVPGAQPGQVRSRETKPGGGTG